MNGKNSQQIARETNAPVFAIQSICEGKTWRHLSGAPSKEELAKGGVKRSKLTPRDIAEIKTLIASGMTNVAIAARFGISTAPISNIRNHGTTWLPKP